LAVSGLTLVLPHLGFRVRTLASPSSVCDDLPHMPVTVVIVDDHSAFRSSARRMLEGEGFEVVGEAADGSTGLDAVRAKEPDVVLLDIALPDLSGYDVAERLADTPSKVVLTSSRAQADLGRRLRDSRALGFIPKDRLSGDAIHSLLQGDR
jgi:DNA-binding NarL/FixJ family response regulator